MTRTLPFLAILALLAACAAEPTDTHTPADRQGGAAASAGATTTAGGAAAHASPNASANGSADAAADAAADGSAEVQRDLATLRRVTARFHRFEAATAAGWSAQITGCLTHPDSGGMGFHYGNPALIDGHVQVDEPELLLYEPEKNGRLRLVAVEYIIPVGAWSSPSPPRLFGRDFRVNEHFNVWALHAWVWEHNPTGIFTDWNPRVDCEFAPPSARASMVHRLP